MVISFIFLILDVLEIDSYTEPVFPNHLLLVRHWRCRSESLWTAVSALMELSLWLRSQGAKKIKSENIACYVVIGVRKLKWGQ